jgi:hypothetical protein
MEWSEGYFTFPGGNPGRTYDVSPDGQRFLMIKSDTSGQAGAPSMLIIVHNWFEELKARVLAQ